MAEYRLSVRAAAQILDIYSFTEQAFGSYQAEAYYAGLERTFDLIAHFPLIGESNSDLAENLRRFRFQSHQIFYAEEDGLVLIRAVVHRLQEIKPSLFQ